LEFALKIVQVDEVPLRSRGDGSGHAGGRGGPGHSSRDIFTAEILGRDGFAPDNFTCNLSTTNPGEFMTPRHHHNFDQMRYMLEGKWQDPTGYLEAGSLGVFPEGTYYGPQDQPDDCGTVLVLQFGGASGAGYIPKELMRKAAGELKAKNVGVFEDGLYKRNPGIEGPPVQDAYEAIWEYVKQRPMEYPKAQYPTPIFVDSKVFPWMPLAGVPGVEEKALGTFTSCQYRVARYQLAPGAVFTATGRGIYFVLSGAGTLEDGPFRYQTALYLDEEEKAVFTASEISDVLYLGLPRRALMQTLTEPTAVAAE
jgi:mannose-6-phosphate isomerase-like protein (cupin superfamily)